MKISRLLLFAANAAIAAAATAETPEVFTPTPVNSSTAISLVTRGLKNLECSYLQHSAQQVHHGAPGIALRFHNTAATERSFSLLVKMRLSATVVKDFSIQPGGTTEFTIFLPVACELGDTGYSSDISLMETTPKADNPHYAHSILNDVRIEFASSSDSDPQVLLSERIKADKLADDLSQALVATKYSQRHKERHYYGSTKGQPNSYQMDGRQFKFAAADWPRDWRCYSTYDAIFITASEYGSLNSEAKSALDVYRKMGGAVIVTEGADGFADPSEAGRALKPIDDSCDALSRDLGISRYYYSYSNHGSNLVKDLQRIPIEAKSTIPVKTLLAVLAVFALAIVPFVIFRSVKRNARMKLLVLLPGSAALFAVLIAVFAFAFFGTTPSVRMQSVTILDQTTKRALTRGQFAVFSPVSIDGLISFPLDSAFMRRSVGGSSDGVYVNIADVQRLDGRWVTPLVTTFFDFERVCERSERLDFRVSQTGGVTVVNLLGEKVVWGQANVNGTLWAFRDVPAGGEVAARKVGEPTPGAAQAAQPFNEKTAYGRDWKECITYATSRSDKIPPGEYVAEVEGSPFFANPVSKKTDTSASGLVYGKFKEVAE